MKMTSDTVAKEICQREKSEHREVNITDVKRVMRHFLDIVSEVEILEMARHVETINRRGVLIQFGEGLSFVVDEIIKKRRKSKRPTGKAGR